MQVVLFEIGNEFFKYYLGELRASKATPWLRLIVLAFYF
jgi:hypothetical protein